jgi:hypothetical protein
MIVLFPKKLVRFYRKKFGVNEGRGQEAVFVTGIYAPLQKLFALKGEVLDPIFSIKLSLKVCWWG